MFSLQLDFLKQLETLMLGGDSNKTIQEKLKNLNNSDNIIDKLTDNDNNNINNINNNNNNNNSNNNNIDKNNININDIDNKNHHYNNNNIKRKINSKQTPPKTYTLESSLWSQRNCNLAKSASAR